MEFERSLSTHPTPIHMGGPPYCVSVWHSTNACCAIEGEAGTDVYAMRKSSGSDNWKKSPTLPATTGTWWVGGGGGGVGKTGRTHGAGCLARDNSAQTTRP